MITTTTMISMITPTTPKTPTTSTIRTPNTNHMLTINQRIKAMLWDLPADKRDKIADEIMDNPVAAFENNEQFFIKALNSLTWYDLIKLLGKYKLNDLLKDETMNKLFPPQRRKFYKNAKRLLSKYALSSPG